MKKWIFLIILALTITLLAACSSKERNAVGATVKVTEENKSFIEKYDKSLQGFITDMTSILKTFNNSLDGIYTKKYSEEQFATVITKSIEESNHLVTEVESVNVNPELFEAHQNLILLINRSHQLLLDAVDMANNEDLEIDKVVLRNEYLEIKMEQAKIANQWKLLREDLESTEDGIKKK